MKRLSETAIAAIAIVLSIILALYLAFFTNVCQYIGSCMSDKKHISSCTGSLYTYVLYAIAIIGAVIFIVNRKTEKI